jgi:hypothetical protein
MANNFTQSFHEVSKIPNMYSPYVSMFVDGEEWGNFYLSEGEREPKILKSFTMTRKVAHKTDFDVANPVEGSVTLASSVFRTSANKTINIADRIVKLLSKYNNVVKFNLRYGYAGTEISSPVYQLQVMGLSLADYYSVTLNFIGTGGDEVYKTYTAVTKDVIKRTKFYSYSDIVKTIAYNQGWNVGKIEETTKFTEPIVFRDVTISPIDYIKKYCLDKAVTDKGESDFVIAFIDPHGKTGSPVSSNLGINSSISEPMFYYVPSRNLKNKVNYKSAKNYNFSMNYLPNSKVISWNPILDLTRGFPELAYKDRTDKNAFKNVYGVISNDTKELIKIDSDFKAKEDKDTLSGVGTTQQPVTTRNPVSNASFDDMSKIAESHLKNNINDYTWGLTECINGTLTTLGDPELSPYDTINIIPMYFIQDSKSDAIMHPTGGTYYISSIIDSISASNMFTSSLEVIKIPNSVDIDKLSKSTVRYSEATLANPPNATNPQNSPVPQGSQNPSLNDRDKKPGSFTP